MSSGRLPVCPVNIAPVRFFTLYLSGFRLLLTHADRVTQLNNNIFPSDTASGSVQSPPSSRNLLTGCYVLPSNIYDDAIACPKVKVNIVTAV